mgnify:CR=1 FL=1|jgi:hypothetical protein
MKITKSQLETVIKEEIAGVLNENKMRKLSAMIRHKAAFWVESEGFIDKDIIKNPGAAWAEILGAVEAHWGVARKSWYGCAGNAPQGECPKINGVLAELRAALDKANDAPGGIINKRWVRKNWRTIQKSFDFIPASNSGKDLLEVPGWKTVQPVQAPAEEGDDL